MMKKPNTPDSLQTLADTANLQVEEVEEVFNLLHREHVYTDEMLLAEMRWFYGDLGLGQHYFRTTPRALVARHMESLFAAKLLARSGGDPISLHHESETEDLAIYATREEHAVAARIERRIERKFPRHRLQSYHSEGVTSPGDPESRLRLYFVSPAHFDDHEIIEDATAIEDVASPLFLERARQETQRRYERAIERAVRTLGLVIDLYDRPDLGTRQFVLAYRRGGTHSFFSAVSDLLNTYGLHSKRKYIEQFKNGIVLYSIHIDASVKPAIVEQVQEDLSLAYVLPRTALTPLFRRGELSAQEVVYAYVVWKFAHQFLFRYSREYRLLAPAFADDPVRLGLLSSFKVRLNKDTFTESRILESIFEHVELIKDLYADFALHHFAAPDHAPTSFDPKHGDDLQRRLTQGAASSMDQQILSAFLTFNRHVLKTNFYRDSKIALAFRLDPSFLPETEYRDRPFGIFFLVGSEFRGFHVRFRDVARGGIRIIKSPNPQAFRQNNDFLFDEVYQLAYTQQSKNKDIPEGGSKGAILLSAEHQDKASLSFKKYTDALLDVLLPNSEIADHYGEQEILFLGPDEGTAEFMDWAATRARQRGYPFWKAFTTGKSVALGGIPHDRYGMTTRSVHQYVVGTLNKLGLQESEVTKIQTGGPDGDLGSNEIKISHDRTLAIVDGSGVLYDPQGIDRDELATLAGARQMVCNFDQQKLSRGGFFVSVTDRSISLPDGSFVDNGLIFRNRFHLQPLAKADLFVPCGGRPDSVHINNVAEMLDAEQKSRFRIIVEGANLFFTQPARHALEQAGAILFKDASANKGGVTSSSLEVLASLALTDEEFEEHMAVRDDCIPDFYLRLIEQVHQRIEENARLEFECIWREHERTGVPHCELSDRLSAKINQLDDDIRHSELVDLPHVRHGVLEESCPEALREILDTETLLRQLPQTYVSAVVGAHLASRYIYRYGLAASELHFVEFLRPYLT